MATDPWARDILLDTAWRLVAGPGAQPRRRVGDAARRAAPDPGAGPPGAQRRRADPTKTPKRAPSAARPSRPTAAGIAALTLLRRVPLVLGRCVLELLPVLAFLAVGHLLAATSLGGSDPPRLVLLAVIDAYALCAAILCVARVMFSPSTAAPAPADDDRRHGRLRHALDQPHRGGQRVRLCDRRGRAAARPVGRRARRAAEGGRASSITSSSASSCCSSDGRCGGCCARPRARVGPVAALRNWLARIWHWLALMLLAGAVARLGGRGAARLRPDAALCRQHRRGGDRWRGCCRSSFSVRSTARCRCGRTRRRAIPASRRASRSITRCWPASRAR